MARRRYSTKELEAMEAFRDAHEAQHLTQFGEGRYVQDRTQDVTTKVRASYSVDEDRPTSDFIIANRSGHQHVVVDDEGNEIHNERADGRYWPIDVVGPLTGQSMRRELATIRDFINEWDQCLAMLDSTPDMIVAGCMTNVVGNDHFDEIYLEGQGEPGFVQLFDLVAQHETPISIRNEDRQDAWRRVGELLRALESRHLSPDADARNE